MLELPFSFFISKKTCEILIFRTFLAKFSIFAYISLKIGYFKLGDDYDVTETSNFECWYLFWYEWKEETLAILWYNLDVSGGFIFKFTGGGNHPSPLVRRVTKKTKQKKKGSIRRGLTILSNK